MNNKNDEHCRRHEQQQTTRTQKWEKLENSYRYRQCLSLKTSKHSATKEREGERETEASNKRYDFRVKWEKSEKPRNRLHFWPAPISMRRFVCRRRYTRLREGKKKLLNELIE